MMNTVLKGFTVVAVGCCASLSIEGANTDETVKVPLTIDTYTVINPAVSKYLFGINLYMWSPNIGTKQMEKRLKELGATLIEYPGGNPRGRYWWHNNRLANYKADKLPESKISTATASGNANQDLSKLG